MEKTVVAHRACLSESVTATTDSARLNRPSGTIAADHTGAVAPLPTADPTDRYAQLRARTLERYDAVHRLLHSYDGHLADLPESDQQEAVARELRELVGLAERLEAAGNPVGEVIAGSSHTFIPGARTEVPEPWGGRITFGPGTVVYNDLRSLDRFGDKGFQSAAFVLSRVVSRPGERVLTLDAGLTTIQVDGGRPHAQVLGLSALVGAPSQEHLKVTVQSGPLPAYGEPMLLVPRHVDTTLAQFDRVYLVGDGAVREAETVLRPFACGSPRGRPDGSVRSVFVRAGVTPAPTPMPQTGRPDSARPRSWRLTAGLPPVPAGERAFHHRLGQVATRP